MTDKMTGYKTSKQIRMQLLQTGTDEKPSSKTVSQVLLIFTIRLMTTTMSNLELRGQGTPTGA
jgi:hypothetical protein